MAGRPSGKATTQNKLRPDIRVTSNNRAGIWIAPGGQLINNGYLKIQGSVKSNNSPYEYTPAYFADNLGLVISGGTKDYKCPDPQYEFANSEVAYRPSLISGNIESLEIIYLPNDEIFAVIYESLILELI